jgi:hypothetical protein
MAVSGAISGYYQCVAKRMKAEPMPAIQYDSFILKQLSQFFCCGFLFSHYQPPFLLRCDLVNITLLFNSAIQHQIYDLLCLAHYL